MKISSPALQLALCFLASVTCAIAQDTPPATSAPEASVLQTLPDTLQKLDDEVARKIEEVRALIETEVAAKRISEPVAQSLRWSLRTTATAGGVVDVRAIVNTMRVPTDNAALTQAVKELETAYTVAQARRAALGSEAAREIRRRVAELIRTAEKAEEIEALQLSLTTASEALKRRSAAAGNDVNTALTGADQLLRAVRRLIEAQKEGKPDAIGAATSPLRTEYRSDRDPAYDSEIQRRLERVVAPFLAAVEKAEIETAAAITGRKPVAEAQVAIARLEDAGEQLAQVRPNTGFGAGQRDPRQLASNYRSIINALSAKGGAEYGVDKLSAARSAAQQLGAKRTAEMEALFTKLSAEAAEEAAKIVVERGEKLRTRIANAKQPSDLDAIAADLRRWTAEAMRSAGSDRENWNQLAGKLSQLSAAWATVSPALLQQNRYESGDGNVSGGLAGELAALRKRIERDVLSRAFQAPELNVPPLADMTPEAALDAFCDQLAAKAEWRRLYDMLNAQFALLSASGRRSDDDALTALRAYFTAQNLELAEQWADAVQSYKSVLRSVSPRAPTRPAAERIKSLAKERPEAFPAPAPAPQPGILRQ
jgi:hypothetical protein